MSTILNICEIEHLLRLQYTIFNIYCKKAKLCNFFKILYILNKK